MLGRLFRADVNGAWANRRVLGTVRVRLPLQPAPLSIKRCTTRLQVIRWHLQHLALWLARGLIFVDGFIRHPSRRTRRVTSVKAVIYAASRGQRQRNPQ
jgi:hypothetical protein